jgi:hypothetical protein
MAPGPRSGDPTAASDASTSNDATDSPGTRSSSSSSSSIIRAEAKHCGGGGGVSGTGIANGGTVQHPGVGAGDDADSRASTTTTAPELWRDGEGQGLEGSGAAKCASGSGGAGGFGGEAAAVSSTGRGGFKAAVRAKLSGLAGPLARSLHKAGLGAYAAKARCVHACVVPLRCT